MDDTDTNAQQNQPIIHGSEPEQWRSKTDDTTTVGPKPKAPTVTVALSITLTLLNIILSATSYHSMTSGSGSWAEGRVFGYIAGYIDIPVIFVTFTLNIIATTKTLLINKTSPTYISSIILNIITWILWGILGLLAYMILTFNSA